MTELQETLASRLARSDPATLSEIRDLIVDPLIALQAAACGDINAQRKLAMAAWARTDTVNGVAGLSLAYERDGTLESALIFARLAAAHGTEQDVLTLANWLSIAAGLVPEREPHLMGEAIGWVQRGADAGSERAAEALNRLVAGASLEAVGIGREYRERLERLVSSGAVHADHQPPGHARAAPGLHAGRGPVDGRYPAEPLIPPAFLEDEEGEGSEWGWSDWDAVDWRELWDITRQP